MSRSNAKNALPQSRRLQSLSFKGSLGRNEKSAWSIRTPKTKRSLPLAGEIPNERAVASLKEIEFDGSVNYCWILLGSDEWRYLQ